MRCEWGLITRTCPDPRAGRAFSRDAVEGRSVRTVAVGVSGLFPGRRGLRCGSGGLAVAVGDVLTGGQSAAGGGSSVPGSAAGTAVDSILVVAGASAECWLSAGRQNPM